MMRFTSTLALAATLSLLSIGAQAAAPSNWPAGARRRLRGRVDPLARRRRAVAESRAALARRVGDVSEQAGPRAVSRARSCTVRRPGRQFAEVAAGVRNRSRTGCGPRRR